MHSGDFFFASAKPCPAEVAVAVSEERKWLRQLTRLFMIDASVVENRPAADRQVDDVDDTTG